MPLPAALAAHGFFAQVVDSERQPEGVERFAARKVELEVQRPLLREDCVKEGQLGLPLLDKLQAQGHLCWSWNMEKRS